ncbi:MAG TPA: hypothetical protein VGN19_13175 [Pedococcus sp.]|jgi:hypothetical protein|nr:hypothetical protein [Pedococcus sp.]
MAHADGVYPVKAVLGRFSLVACGTLLLAVVAVAVVAPRASNTPLRQWVVLVAMASLALVGVVLMATVSHDVLELIRRRPQAASWVVTAAGLALCTPVALWGGYRPGWDAGGLLQITGTLGAGRPLNHATLVYLAAYPNNDGALALLLMARRLGAGVGLDAYTMFVLLNCLCLGVVLLSCFAVASRLRGPVAGVAAQLLCIALIGLSPWMSVSYTDVLTTPIPIGAFALVALAAERRQRWARAALVVAALVALGVGYSLKPTLAVATAALGAAGLLVLPGRSPRRLVAGLAVIALGAGVTVASAMASQDGAAQIMAANGVRIDSNHSVPPDRYVLDGLQQGSHGTTKVAYGAYSAAVVSATYGMTTHQMTIYSRRNILLRLHNLGVTGYATFAAKKTAWNWGDGMFYAFGESAKDAKLTSVISHSPPARLLAQVNHSGGQWYPLRAELTQALWLLVLLVGGVGLLVARPRPGTVLLALAVLGIAAFTTIFQGRSRYLLTFVPVVLTLVSVVAIDPRRLLAPHRLFRP